MKRQSILILIIALIILTGTNNAYADTHYANPSNYRSVISAASSGDTVIFTNGNYNVNNPINLAESLRLISQNPGGAVLRATRDIHTIFDVWSPYTTISGFILDCNYNADNGIHGGFGGDYSNNGHFTDNTILNSNSYGIFLNNSAYSVFSNNRVDGGRLGIAVIDSPLSVLSGNHVTNVDYTGITVGESQLATLTGNTVSGSGQDGILIRQSPYSQLENNNAFGNNWGGISVDRSSNSLLMNNRATDNGVGIALHSTDSAYILLNNLLYSDYGVAVDSGGNNQIIGNNMQYNVIGIQMRTNNNVSYNNITNNTGAGISLETSYNNINTSLITNNTVIWNMNGFQIIGSQNNINSNLLQENLVLENTHALYVQGNGNLLNETLLYGNINGLHITGNNNILTNLTAVYNSLTGIIINGIGNTLENSLILNNTNGISIIGDINAVRNILILNTTNGLILNGNQNIINGTEVLNSTNGLMISGNGNNITNNNVYNNSNNGIDVSGDNIVTGNTITQNNGTGLVIRTDNNNVDLTSIVWNMIFNNGGGITISGDGNNIDNVLMLFNMLLNNNYTLTITGNNNQLNNTIFTLNRNGLQINGDNNNITNITAHNNETGVIINGNNNSVNSSLIQNNTDGVLINGNQNTINGTQINNNNNGIQINGSENTINQTNIRNNSQTAVTVIGDNNTFLQNNITGSNEAILIENGTNNTLNYNRLAGNGHNLTNKGNGTVNASYNWWGQNNPTGITGNNISTSNHVTAILNIEGVNNGVIQPGTIYDVTLTLRSADGQELALEIPSFLVQFFFGGDIYPEETTMVNNTAWTRLQVFNPGSYTLTAVVDQQILTSILSTPVNSQPVTPVKIPRKQSAVEPANNLCGAVALANLLASIGLPVNPDNVASLAGITDEGISFLGLVQAAKYFGVDLTGLKLDSSQLRAGDIVLLNMNGANHYGIILGKIGDYIILQDPFMGTVVLSLDKFNKLYAGYALTLNPDGRGLVLNEGEMEGLIGGLNIEDIRNWISFITYGYSYNEYYNQNVNDFNSFLLLSTQANAGQMKFATNPSTFPIFLAERILIEPHDDIWEYINPSFIKFYGVNCENLDPESKMWIEAITGIDPQGNMSLLDYILTLLILLPGEALGATGVRILSKAGLIEKILTKIPVISEAWRALKTFAEPLTKDFPILEEAASKTWKTVVTGAKLLNLNPLAWYDNLVKVPFIGKRISKLSRNYPIIADLAKSVYDGPLSFIGWTLGKISQYSPLKYETLKSAAKFGANIITVYSAANKINELINAGSNALNIANQDYEAAKSRVVSEYQKVRSQGLDNYIKTEAPKYVETIKKNPIVKAVLRHPVTQRIIGYGKTAIKYGKAAINAVKSVGSAIYNGVKSLGTAIYNGVQSLGNTIYKGITNIFRW